MIHKRSDVKYPKKSATVQNVQLEPQNVNKTENKMVFAQQEDEQENDVDLSDIPEEFQKSTKYQNKQKLIELNEEDEDDG